MEYTEVEFKDVTIGVKTDCILYDKMKVVQVDINSDTIILIQGTIADLLIEFQNCDVIEKITNQLNN